MTTRLLLIATAAALLASACVKVDMRIEVADDGSAEISGVLAMNVEAITKLAEDFGDAESMGTRDELCAEFTADQDLSDVGEMTTAAYDEDGFCGVEFNGQLSSEQVASEMGAVSGSDIVLTRDGDNWFFEMELTDAALGTEDLDEAGDLFDVEDLFGEAEYVIRVKLPGKQVEHNGDFIEGDGTVGWDIDILNPPTSLFLRTEPGEPETGGGLSGGDDGGGGNTGLVIAIVVLALIAIGLAAYFVTRNKNANQSGAAPTGAAGGFGESAPVVPPTMPPTDMPSTDRPTTQMPAAGMPAQATPTQEAVADLQTQGATTPPQDQSIFDTTASAAAAEAAPPPEPTAPEPQAPAEPQVAASPTPEEATGTPVWDPNRGSYVQWDPQGARWLVYDNDAAAWKPE